MGWREREGKEENAKSKMLQKTGDVAEENADGEKGKRKKQEGEGRTSTSRDNCAIRAINICNVSIRRR